MAKILISVIRLPTSDFRLLRSGSKKIVLAVLLFTIFFVNFFPLTASAAFQLVPCGTQRDASGVVTNQCTFCDLVGVVIRMINYLIGVAVMVAMYFILLNAWNLITSVGNSEKIEKAKTGISNAVVGFGIVILAFVFVNLLVNGIFGKPDAERKWWEPRCIFDITNPSGCPSSCEGSSASGGSTFRLTDSGQLLCF